jgi:hypothetical protein
LFAQKIGQDPNIESKDDANEVNNKPDENEADKENEQIKRNKPNCVFQLKGPDWEQDQRKDCQYGSPHHPFF